MSDPMSDIISQASRSLSLSQARCPPFEYKWTIQNLRSLQKMNGLYLIDSPLFTALNHAQPWKVVIYQGNMPLEEMMTVSLVMMEDNARIQFVDYDCKVSDEAGRIINASYGCVSVRGRHFVSLVDFELRSFMISEELNVELKMWRAETNSKYFAPARKTYLYDRTDHKEQHEVPNLALDMGEAYLSGGYHDVELVVEQRRFKAHRVVLAARSHVLAMIFQPKMQEPRGDDLVIRDFKPAVVQKFLQFCYSDAVENIELDVFALLQMADRYSVRGLRWICEKCLLALMNVENALDIMMVADFLKDDQLMNKTVEFIRPRYIELTKSNRYAELEKTRDFELQRLIWMVAHHSTEDPQDNVEIKV